MLKLHGEQQQLNREFCDHEDRCSNKMQMSKSRPGMMDCDPINFTFTMTSISQPGKLLILLSYCNSCWYSYSTVCSRIIKGTYSMYRERAIMMTIVVQNLCWSRTCT